MKKLLLLLLLATSLFGQRWTEKAVNDWYAKQPWLVGANYVPSTAINQLEMWQKETFDPIWMETEITWGEDLGMNTMRVFLHDLLWKSDPDGFQSRISRFLAICDRHKIKPILVLFDSVWDPYPQMGTQRPPKPGVHNSGWVQSPGSAVLQNPAEFDRLRQYVQGVIGAFRYDRRVLAWDLWNEPDNENGSSYKKLEPAKKQEIVAKLLPKVFEWAHAMEPNQPVTSGLWNGGDWSSLDKLTPIQKVQVEQSDIISFHSYDKPEEFEKRVKSLQGYHRPIFCTEYMARPRGSTFQVILPIAKQYKVAAINWGFVSGKSQTIFAWDTWQTPSPDAEPKVWFHDIFRKDGTPFSQAEYDFIKDIIGASKPKKGKAKK